MPVKFVNDLQTRIATVGGINSTATSVDITAGDGTKIQNAVDFSSSEWCYATFKDVSGNIETVKITAATGDTLTIERGADGDTPRAWAQNDILDFCLNKKALEDLVNEIIGANIIDAVNLKIDGTKINSSASDIDAAVAHKSIVSGNPHDVKLSDLGVSSSASGIDAAVDHKDIVSGNPHNVKLSDLGVNASAAQIDNVCNHDFINGYEEGNNIGIANATWQTITQRYIACLANSLWLLSWRISNASANQARIVLADGFIADLGLTTIELFRSPSGNQIFSSAGCIPIYCTHDATAYYKLEMYASGSAGSSGLTRTAYRQLKLN